MLSGRNCFLRMGKSSSKEGILYTIVAVLSVLFSMSTVDTMMWAALVTGGLAILRAIRMLRLESICAQHREETHPAWKVSTRPEWRWRPGFS